jgi:TPR repeat protein
MAKNEPTKSIRYLRNSCGLGYGEACYKLGSLTENTMNNTQNAVPFFELGCTFKHKESCKKLKLLSTNN